jgi:hypothetical protein
MARVSKEITFTGTIGDVCFYRWGDRIFARKKSSLTKERVLKDKKFAGLRKHAGDMGRASKLASEIYRQLPADIKGRWIFRTIAGQAASLLYKGKTHEQVKEALLRKYVNFYHNLRSIKSKKESKQTGSGLVLSSKQANRDWEDIFRKHWKQQGKPAEMFDLAWQHKQRFNPYTIPRRSEYFLSMEQASGLTARNSLKSQLR